jgi:GTPase SAR1 family protein
MSYFKICICGDKNTGKTTYLSTISRYYYETIEGVIIIKIKFRIKHLNVDRFVIVELYEVGENIINEKVLRQCFSDANGVLIFDSKDSETRGINNWLNM